MMDDTATELKCFPWSPNHTAKKTRNSSPCWFFRILHPSNRKINVISVQEDQVSNEVQTGQTVSKEEYDRVLQERNSLNDQLRGNEEEIIRLKNQVRLLASDLSWLLSDWNDDPLIPQTIVTNLSHIQGKTGSSSNNIEQQSLATADSNVVNKDQNKEKAREGDKNRPVRVERDIIGATPSPMPLYPRVRSGGTPPKPPRPTEESTMSYTEIFNSIRDGKQFKAAGPEPARAPNNLLSYTEIFRKLVGNGLIAPQSPETDKSGLYSYSSYLQICEYHKGGRGHSTENCTQLRLQVQKLIRDGIIKIEPPNLVVVAQKNSSVPKFGEWT